MKGWERSSYLTFLKEERTLKRVVDTLGTLQYEF